LFPTRSDVSPNKDTPTRAVKRELTRERERTGVRRAIKRCETYFIARIRERVYYRREESTKFQWRLLKDDVPPNLCLKTQTSGYFLARNKKHFERKKKTRERDHRKAELL